MYSQEGRKVSEVWVVVPEGLKLPAQGFRRIVALINNRRTNPRCRRLKEAREA